MSAFALAVLAFLTAMPATWCVCRMVSCIPGWIEPILTHDARVSSEMSFGWNVLEFLILAASFVLSILTWGATVQAVSAMLLISMLVALAWIDYRTGLLPDVLTKSGALAGLLINVWSVWVPWHTAVIGALAGYLLLWLFFHLYRLATHKEGMGHGDFKLFAMLGAWLGWQSLAPILLVASVSAMAVAIVGMATKRLSVHSSMPFGPFLVFGGMLRLVEWIEVAGRDTSFFWP